MLAGLLVGCAAGPDMSALSNGNPASGERVYEQEGCASCHGAAGEGGSGGSLGSVHGMDDVEVWEFIYYGTDGMPDYPYLSEQEIADMIAWMRVYVL
ncbi:MAG: mono/diheme cytochrome c family protein [Myxococcota bacterium]|jgi:mono/diheme cytochrome c family protein